MAQKDKILDFIEELYGEQKGQSYSKEDIMSRVVPAKFAADVQVFFKELPERDYDERKLIDELNSIVARRGRAQAIGGTIGK